MACLPARLSRSATSGLTLMAVIAPLASLPILINWVFIVFTLSRATFSIRSNSLLNSLPKVLLDAPAKRKYSPIENLFLSRAVVKDSVLLFTVVIDAANLPVALRLFINPLWRF